MISRIGGLIRRKGFLAILFVVLHIAGFVSSIDAVMRARTSQGAIAWVISLNTIPIASLPSYWVFGRTKFQGYVLARQQDDSALSDLVSQKMDGKKAGLTSTLKFDFLDEGVFRLVFENGACRLEPGDGDAAGTMKLKWKDAFLPCEAETANPNCRCYLSAVSRGR